ncbi:MAG TPA: glutamate--cysteine ligase [Steroidobacteraceae bacterium]|nr:glutamate--cysteine ligase [Steroidobacteraceae bacterium]
MAVDRLFERRIAGLINSREQRLLARGPRGVERESLRVNPDGGIAQTPHPRGLGSALTNAHVTTDYAEALTELVTPTFEDNPALMHYLTDLHQFVYGKLGEELLWASSMPCVLHGESDVPIAVYGRSHQARVKSIYRHGLMIRYGGVMQAISGVHFNYSLPAQFWPLYAEICQSHDAGRDFVSASYFDLLRNYRRHGWLISYLFGCSPALCRSFLQGRSDAGLEPLGSDTLIGPDATSLRMSDIGYRNRGQTEVPVSVNHIDEYLRDLHRAIAQPHPPFAALGVKVDGEYQQLSANLLQIENEYYSYIRPKRTLRAGERTLHALARGGVEYVEVRALDNGVYDPVGVNERKLYFLEAFVQLLLLKTSPPIDAGEEEAIDRNHLVVARRGRERGLTLTRDGREVSMQVWALELLDSMQGICECLDAGLPERPYAAALREQIAKLEDVARTPSARLLAELRQQDKCFSTLTLRHSVDHRRQIELQPRNVVRQDEFDQEAHESLDAQGRLEASQRGTFDEYLDAYLGV